ncbi:MAG: hypothetical protein OEW11_06270 [Nitrospirota bacterium]|nr:hypothetical protein [Nitrospirota bacterium]
MLRLWPKKLPLRPLSGRLLLVIALVVGHCCMVTLPSHAVAGVAQGDMAQGDTAMASGAMPSGHAGHGRAAAPLAHIPQHQTVSAPPMAPCGTAPYLAAERAPLSPKWLAGGVFAPSPLALAAVLAAEWPLTPHGKTATGWRGGVSEAPPGHSRAHLQIFRI